MTDPSKDGKTRAQGMRSLSVFTWDWLQYLQSCCRPKSEVSSIALHGVHTQLLQTESSWAAYTS